MDYNLSIKINRITISNKNYNFINNNNGTHILIWIKYVIKEFLNNKR